MKHVVAVFVVAFTLVACGPGSEQIEATVVARVAQAVPATLAAYTPVPTHTPFPTYTSVPTIAIEVTRVATKIVIVTATSTPTPRYTPTNTPTPSLTPTPTKTPTLTPSPNKAQTATAKAFAAMTQPISNGFYLVGIDIAPGLWRSTSSRDDCYWERLDVTGNIIDNHYGLAGGTINIRATDFQFYTQDCGVWEYLGR